MNNNNNPALVGYQILKMVGRFSRENNVPLEVTTAFAAELQNIVVEDMKRVFTEALESQTEGKGENKNDSE